jgi:hypothetical protein
MNKKFFMLGNRTACSSALGHIWLLWLFKLMQFLATEYPIRDVAIMHAGLFCQPESFFTVSMHCNPLPTKPIVRDSSRFVSNVFHLVFHCRCRSMPKALTIRMAPSTRSNVVSADRSTRRAADQNCRLLIRRKWSGRYQPALGRSSATPSCNQLKVRIRIDVHLQFDCDRQ